MTIFTHEITIHSDKHFGKRLPSHYLGLLLAEVPVAVQYSVSMALRNRSTGPGKIPGWLRRSADIRFVGHDGTDESHLYFEAPTLGEAAAELYAQKALYPDLESRPPPEDTGFDLFADVLADIQARNADSTHFDPTLLDRVAQFRRVFRKGPFTEIDVTGRRYSAGKPARVTPDVIESAYALLGRTPAPQRVRLVGQLDALVASTQRFSVLLDSGEKVDGVFSEDQIDSIQDLWRKRVLVLGTAIYRASGRLLRIDAETVTSGGRESSIFSQMPAPRNGKLDISKLRKPQGPRSGMAAIMGRWPGDETDEEIEAALKELS
jgi:hypothetical protein